MAKPPRRPGGQTRVTPPERKKTGNDSRQPWGRSAPTRPSVYDQGGLACNLKLPITWRGDRRQAPAALLTSCSGAIQAEPAAAGTNAFLAKRKLSAAPLVGQVPGACAAYRRGDPVYPALLLVTQWPVVQAQRGPGLLRAGSREEINHFTHDRSPPIVNALTFTILKYKLISLLLICQDL